MKQSGHAAVARLAAGLVAMLAFAALGLQYLLLLRASPDGVALSTLRFLSYFTILSNLLVAGVALSIALRWRSALLATPRAMAAALLYIAITGLVYVGVLRHLWQPQGLQWWADTGLHYGTPLAWLAWWLVFAVHGQLRWRDVGTWLLFPLGFLCWTLLRGAWLSEYPYPFIDAGVLGYALAMRNTALVCVAFVAVGGLLVAIDRALGRRHRTAR